MANSYNKVLNITNHKGNGNQSYNNISPLGMASIKKSKDNKYWQRYGEKGTFAQCWWGCKLVQPL